MAISKNRQLSGIDYIAVPRHWQGVSEIRLWQQAYYVWFGQRAVASVIEQAYINYRISGDIPYWLRHYQRLLSHSVLIEKTVHPQCKSAYRWIRLMAVILLGCLC